MNGKTEAFFTGLCAGALIIVFILFITGATPAERQCKIHKEAVERGYGRWVVDTNSFDISTPTTHFEWIENKQK
jgi:hypothetical protein